MFAESRELRGARTAIVIACGRIGCQGRKINVSQVFAGQNAGVRQTDDDIWLVTFMDYDLGCFRR